MTARKTPQEQRVPAIEEMPERGLTNALNPATVDEIARIGSVPPEKLALFKKELFLILEWAKVWRAKHRRAKRGEVLALLNRLIAALEPFLDDESESVRVAGQLLLPSLDLNQHTFRTRPVIKNLLERAQIAKERAKLKRPDRGAPRGTRQGSELDAVLLFLLGRAKDWGVKWTSYKDRGHNTAKGTLVQVLRLLEPHLVLPRNDRTLLKVIDRVRKRSFPFKIHMSLPRHREP